MQKSTKLLSLTVALVLTASIFSGCSKGGTTTEEKNAKKIAYPEKSIQIIVPAGTGGDTDTNVRLLAPYLEKELGQSVLVKNVNGQGGTLGSKEAKAATPDGYTVLFYHPSIMLNKLSGLVDYGFSDFENASIPLYDTTNLFAVAADSKYKTLQDLVTDAKANPGTVRFATENGGFTHLQVTAFQELAGAELKLVDVGGAAAKMAALKGKTIEVAGLTYGLVKDKIASGEVRVLAVMSDNRSSFMPDVPTFKESGVDMAFDKSYFFLFPKGTPKEVVDKFTQAVSKATTNSEMQAKAKELAVTVKYTDPASSVSYLQAQETLYGKFAGKMKQITK